jgi:peptide/nickel transport system ATP-binding protein/oligopeptide transport system ATP-binding protein
MQILNLLNEAQRDLGSSVLYISHDLANIARICERVMIMYAGEIVESAATRELYREPLHPYTQGLLACIPPLGGETTERLNAIPGMPPHPTDYPSGCRFAPKCPHGRSVFGRDQVVALGRIEMSGVLSLGQRVHEPICTT